MPETTNTPNEQQPQTTARLSGEVTGYMAAPIMLDLCCGLKGASHEMAASGWNVLTLDVESKFAPDVVADLTTWEYTGPRPDLIWCSPPCTEFSRESMPWCRTGNAPDMALVMACKRIIEQVKPRYWVIENVRGAIKYLEPIFGRPRASFGPFFLWGVFPLAGAYGLADFRKKESWGSDQQAERAKVPAIVGRMIMDGIKRRPMLFDYSAM